jgi:hypothetical protein
MNPKSQSDLELLHLWCKEGWVKSVLGDYHEQKQALSCSVEILVLANER